MDEGFTIQDKKFSAIETWMQETELWKQQVDEKLDRLLAGLPKVELA